jgi:hypothetical protein
VHTVAIAGDISWKPDHLLFLDASSWIEEDSCNLCFAILRGVGVIYYNLSNSV